MLRDGNVGMYWKYFADKLSMGAGRHEKYLDL